MAVVARFFCTARGSQGRLLFVRGLRWALFAAIGYRLRASGLRSQVAAFASVLHTASIGRVKKQGLRRFVAAP